MAVDNLLPPQNLKNVINWPLINIVLKNSVTNCIILTLTFLAIKLPANIKNKGTET